MKSCLLIIDVQTGLLAEEPPPPDADDVIARINALANRARSQDLPVIIVQHEEPGTALVPGSSNWEVDSRLHVTPGDLRIRKTTVDSFFETGLQQVLLDGQTTHLVICGYASEFCIDTTVRRAAALGFRVTLVSDAHTTQDKPHLSAGLIRQHHNRTLVELTGFPGKIDAQPAASLW